MTTANLVNPFWGKPKFTYWRFTPIVSSSSPLIDFETAELVLASSPGGANLLASAVSVTAPGEPFPGKFYDGSAATACVDFANANKIPSNTAYVQAQFSAPVNVAEVRITSASGSPDYTPSLWALAGSADGASWTGFGVYSSGSYTANETKTFTIGVPLENGGRAGSRVWLFYNSSPSAVRLRVRELVYATSAGGVQLATGGTAFARKTGTGAASNAFDGNLISAEWSTTSDSRDAVLGYRFTTAPSPTHYRVTGASADYPSAWGIYYLSNCADWVLADSRSGETGWTASETRTYTMAA